MKSIVVFDEFAEIDLKPSDLLGKYKKLTEEEVGRWLSQKGILKETACPACGCQEGSKAFLKFGLQYQECKICKSLYISPRPNDATLSEHYLKAPSRKFWRDELSRATQQKRKEKIIKPRFEWLVDSTKEYYPQAKHLLNMNTDQYGYVEEMLAANFFKQKTLLNPYVPLEKSIPAINVISQPWWETNLKNEIDVVTLFEVLDRTADAEGLLSKVHQMLKPKGLCFITAILVSGFDLQILWEKAENLYPPDRLNLFTIEGLKKIFERKGWELLELSTPGILDVEIVAKALAKNPKLEVPRFARNLIENRNENIKEAFQEFLQASCLSSYGRFLIRKR